MMTLDYWLPEKEMFGTFSLNSLTQTETSVELVASNEVFTFTVTFPQGVKACACTQRGLLDDCVNALLADYEVIMRGNTFFKLGGSDLLAKYGTETTTHYSLIAPNYVVDILSDEAPSVELKTAVK